MTDNTLNKKKKNIDLEQDDTLILMASILSELSVSYYEDPETPEDQENPEFPVGASKSYDFSIQEDKAIYRDDLNAGIGQIADQLRGTKYVFGGKGCGGIDCSGYVAKAVGKAMYMAGVSEKFVRNMNTNSQGQLNVMKEMGVDIVREGDLRSAVSQGVPMFVALDSGDRGWDAGRADGIDHVVVIYEKDGELLVSQSSGNCGVSDMSFDKWMDRCERKGTRLFASDLGQFAMKAKQYEMSNGLNFQAKSDQTRDDFKDNATGFEAEKLTAQVNQTLDLNVPA